MKPTQTSPEALKDASTPKEVIPYPNDTWLNKEDEIRFRKHIKNMINILDKLDERT